MRDYARISPLFWSGDTGRRLRGDGDAQVLAFYLMTCPSSTMSGLFYLPLPTISHETGLSIPATRAALTRLEAAEFAFYDAEAELVWLPEMARCQVGIELSPGDNRIKGLLREIERHRRSPFHAAFLDRYREAYHLPSEYETTAKPLRRGYASAARPLRSQDQDQEQVQDQEQDQEQVAPASPTRVPVITQPEPLRLEAQDADTAAALTRADDALRELATASGGRFVASRLKRGQAIHVQKLLAVHSSSAAWRLVGEWLAAGGEAWRSDLDARCLGDFEAWLAHATKWHDAGRPPLQGRGARAPTAGWAPATTAYERSEDLTDEL